MVEEVGREHDTQQRVRYALLYAAGRYVMSCGMRLEVVYLRSLTF